MDSFAEMLIVWLVLAVVLVIYVLHRILADGPTAGSKKHPLYPLVSDRGDLMFPSKGDYFTWTLYVSWALALLALGACTVLQAFDWPVPRYVIIAVNAIFLTAIGLLGVRVLLRKRAIK